MRCSLLALTAALALVGCTRGSKAPPPEPAPPKVAAKPTAAPPPPPGYEDEWTKTSFGHYLMPRGGFPNDKVDVIFHFHAGRAAERDFRASGMTPLVVVATWGAGTQPYSRAMADPKRFDRMLDEVLDDVRERSGRPNLHYGRISLFAWSAGYASVGRILHEGYGDRVDSVVLLDAPHTAYMGKPPKHSWEVVKRPLNLEGLDAYVAFAKEAAAGKKEFIMTHSSIVPVGYASTTECADAIIAAVGATKVEDGIDAGNGYEELYHADLGNFHVRGYTGVTKEAHVAQIHLLTPLFHDLLAPRWRALDAAPEMQTLVRGD